MNAAVQTATAGLGRYRRWLLPTLSLVVFAAVAYVIDRELRDYHLRDVLAALSGLPTAALLAAAGFTVLSYWSLTLYDVLGLRYIGKTVPYRQAATTSFIAYSFAHNLSLAALTGAAIRYRLYGPAGLTAIDIARVAGFTSVTTALGIALLAGFGLIATPDAIGSALHLGRGWALALGGTILAAVAAYAVWATQERAAADVEGWRVKPPGAALLLPQLAVGAADLALSAAALWVLLPASAGIAFPTFCGIYAGAIVVSLVSHVPGGLGVLESVVLLAVPHSDTPGMLAALVAYRGIYYLLPLACGALLFAGQELAGRAHYVLKAADVFRGSAPQLIGALVFLAGTVLLVSGATPGIDTRLGAIKDLLPLPLLETSHLAGSVIGLALLVLARALFDRVNAGWQFTMFALAAGIAASLLKGLDYEEAILLSVVMGILWLGRGEFYRQASLWSERFTPGWIVNVAIVIGTATWIGFLAHREVPFSSDLWWTFAVNADAPRMLRASLVVALLAAGVVLADLLRPAQPEPDLPTAADLDRARPIIAASESALANVALSGDKHLLFADSGDTFLMYRIAGRSWIALGDPVGPRPRWEDLLWRFRELVDEHGGRTVFYEVAQESLPLYIDLGLTLSKLGEEARVPLAGFSLDGRARAELRSARRRAERDGASFEIVPPAGVPALLPALTTISDQWLEDKAAREKGFSLGFFAPEYLVNFPVALVRRQGTPVAFANLWTTGGRSELSVDLMRFGPDSPHGAMDFLFTELLLWGQAQGYAWFNLGMAPLSGLEDHPLAPAWHRVGNLVFQYGEHFYNFDGLRRYKAKFQPVWQPRYLASPGGLALPRVLVDVSTLISGGVRGLLRK